ncbi:DUF3604 domain-containing protein [Luminiphilus sp. nBUS_16]|uniref:DUF3604 domain-containing protein n=1 Tax=unclassified Luminiphilus TaxID=2633198 RepID=UPI003EB6DCB9
MNRIKMHAGYMWLVTPVLISLTACMEQGPDISETMSARANIPSQVLEINNTIVDRRQYSAERNAYFGDLHVHTGYSFDAYAFGTVATPYDAYRYAKGEPLAHPSGYEMQLRQPLDFYAVTDHAMFMGLLKEAADTTTKFSKTSAAQPIHNINAPDNYGAYSFFGRQTAFATFLPDVVGELIAGNLDEVEIEAVTRSAWADSINAADQYNQPGKFTTFAAYEYTSSTDEMGNLHRNVIFQGTDRLPEVPFSRFHSQNPEGLWNWMDDLRDQGVESLAIPHNSNGSNGAMFALADWAGDPMDDDYADLRMRNEPLVEITQVKGTSETHPLLSETDEWANFELMPFRVATTLDSVAPGSYVRDGLLRGMALSESGTKNPYKFGFVGASDTHTGAISDDEENFYSKVGLLDGTPEMRGSVPASFLMRTIVKYSAPNLLKEVEGKDYLTLSTFATWGASGIAGVWAEENTREAIYDAFRRKETFATSGPRMKVRFFGGYEFDPAIIDDPQMAKKAYAQGVSMGSDLIASGDSAPQFLVWAVSDAVGGVPLQRVQVIKGFVKGGEHAEQVYDVACSDGLSVDPTTHRCPDNGARVNLADCSITPDVGAAELKAVWQDPDFEAGQEAFYYVRVLENPTCRWSTWDAVKAGVEPRPDLPKTLQERVWSSPIWYKNKLSPLERIKASVSLLSDD